MTNKRVRFLFALSVCMLSVLCARVMYFSVFKNEPYTKAVLSQQKTTKTITAVRGTIYDRNLIPLTERNIEKMYVASDGTISTSRGNASFDMPARYDKSGTAAHVTGYVSEDGSGLCAIEKIYDDVLRSEINYKVGYMADGAGRPYPGQTARNLTQKSDDLNSIKLTLDYHIQKIAEDVMDKYIPRGAAVILDVQSFDVLAMVSRPLYDSSDIPSVLASDSGELLNRALCAYNAGSVFKIVTAAAALEANRSYINSHFFCSGSTAIEDKVFPCHKADGHGTQNFSTAFANSCNCAFYETGIYTGGTRIVNTALKLGLGQRVVHWDAEEAEGIIPRKTTYPPLETVNLSIGQGDILITPLQCAVMAATVANKGVRKSVNIADSACDKYGNTTKELRNDQSIKAMSETTAALIGSMMRQSVVSGTAKLAKDSRADISGKTGSAETGWLTDSGELAVHGWFCGYFPYDNPRYAMAIFCEDGKSGADSCVEPFVKICEKIDKIYPLKQ